MESFLKYFLNEASFNIFICDRKTVGRIPAEENKTAYDWRSDGQKPFMDLFHNRLYYVLDGGAVIRTKQGVLNLEAGKMYFIPENTVVSSCCERMVHYYLHFTAHSAISNFFDFCKVTRELPGQKKYLTCFQKIASLLDSNDPGDTLVMQASLRLILAPFFKNATLSDHNISRFFNVLNYIDKNYHLDISVATLANLMNLDYVYFSNLFTQIFETSPKQYIVRRKLNEARRLLVETDFPIKEISQMVGFEDQLYFSKVFKSKIGASPMQYREMMSAVNRL